MTSPRPQRVRIVGAILVQDNRVLLGRRSADRRSYPDAWDLIGGHVEPGETDEQALVREVEEEIGVTARAWSLLAEVDAGETHTLAVFQVTRWTGGAPSIRNDEHSMLAWFTAQEASALENLASPRYVELFSKISIGACP